MSAVFHHLQARARTRQAWKNGAGETMEVAISPAGAGIDDFMWRISIADVMRSGPFSTFAGVERTLAIIEGEGLMLEVGDAPSIALTDQSPPFTFPAHVPATARLVGGPVVDLNVMSRYDRITHRMHRLIFSGAETRIIEANYSVLVWIEGQAQIVTPQGRIRPGSRDAIESVDGGGWTIVTQGAALAYLIELAVQAS